MKFSAENLGCIFLALVFIVWGILENHPVYDPGRIIAGAILISVATLDALGFWKRIFKWFKKKKIING